KPRTLFFIKPFPPSLRAVVPSCGGQAACPSKPWRKRPRAPNPEPRIPIAVLLIDRDKLDVEDEHSVRRTLTFVCKPFANPEAHRFAFGHQLHTLGPTGNHTVEGKRRRLAAHH